MPRKPATAKTPTGTRNQPKRKAGIAVEMEGVEAEEEISFLGREFAVKVEPGVDEEEDCDYTPVKHMTVQPIMPVQPMKRARLDALSASRKEKGTLLLHIKWVHPDYKKDCEIGANLGTLELKNVVNFYERLKMWKKLEQVSGDREKVVKAAWGLDAKQLQQAEREIQAGVKQEPVGVVMFLECEKAHGYIESLFSQVEARGTKSINDQFPCIDTEDVEYMLLQEKGMKLVSDIWSPILDVVDIDYICTNPFWGERFYKATATVLAWMLTFHVKSEKARENANFEPGTYPYTADLVSKAIFKADSVLGGGGDAVVGDWPTLKKPVNWTKKRGQLHCYGALKYAKIYSQLAEAAVEEIDEEIGKPANRIIVPDRPTGLDEMMDVTNQMEQAKWVMDNIKARSAALRLVEVQAGEKARLLEEESEKLLKWMKDMMIYTERAQKGKEVHMAVECYIMNAKRMFQDAMDKEKDGYVERGGLVGSHGDSSGIAEIMGGFAAWIGKMRANKLFKAHVVNYNAATAGMQVGGSSFQGGYMMNQGNMQGYQHGYNQGPSNIPIGQNMLLPLGMVPGPGYWGPQGYGGLWVWWAGNGSGGPGMGQVDKGGCVASESESQKSTPGVLVTSGPPTPGSVSLNSAANEVRGGEVNRGKEKSTPVSENSEDTVGSYGRFNFNVERISLGSFVMYARLVWLDAR
ncbi:hypothetical protein EV426DRAFT_572183 [Tirmania nivea]|nr:hypothetical protein EV426DRAFT_572183 [Tirmania nivea]